MKTTSNPLRTAVYLAAVMALLFVTGCAWLQSVKPIASAADAAAQAACALFVRENPDEITAPKGVEDVADWYCSDPAVLDVFRDQYLRGLERKARRAAR